MRKRLGRCCLLLIVIVCGACESNRGGPAALAAPPPVSNNLVINGIVPVAGRPVEHTHVRIIGIGFQSGAIVTFDGTEAPVTVESDHIILTMAPPHPAGPVDMVVINPDGARSRLEKPFTYVENLLASGDITIGPGDSITSTLNPFERNCTFDDTLSDTPCRLLFIRAPADQMVEVELMSLDGRERIGLYDQGPFQASLLLKRITVRGGQQVWIMGETALFSVTARLAK